MSGIIRNGSTIPTTAEADVTIPIAVIATRGAQIWRVSATVRNTTAIAAPCRSRPSRKTPRLGATRQTTEPTPETKIVISSTRRLPKMSALLASNGAQMAPASSALAFNHAAWSVPKCSSICGSTI
jgi:hypothetical protein